VDQHRLEPQAAAAHGQRRNGNPLLRTLIVTICVTVAALSFGQEYFQNPLTGTHVEFVRHYVHQLCMNALTFYGVLLDWVWNHVTARNMYLIQSATTACALSW